MKQGVFRQIDREIATPGAGRVALVIHQLKAEQSVEGN